MNLFLCWYIPTNPIVSEGSNYTGSHAPLSIGFLHCKVALVLYSISILRIYIKFYGSRPPHFFFLFLSNIVFLCPRLIRGRRLCIKGKTYVSLSDKVSKLLNSPPLDPNMIDVFSYYGIIDLSPDLGRRTSFVYPAVASHSCVGKGQALFPRGILAGVCQ